MSRLGRYCAGAAGTTCALLVLAPSAALAASAGALDPSFADGGNALTSVVADPAGSFDYAEDVTVQSDGKIVAVGATDDSTDILVARYDPDGSLDSTFGGGDGIVTTSIASEIFDVANAVTIQPDGKIVVCGVSQPSTRRQFFVARYNANGTLDTGFDGPGGGNGIVVLDIDPGGEASCQGVAINGTKIVAAGELSPDSLTVFQEAVVVQLNGSDGTLDAGFDGDGGSGNGIVKTELIPGNFYSGAQDVAIQGDGKIVIGGFANAATSDPENNYDGDFALARYDGSTGVLDTGFGGDGIVTTDVAGDGDRINRLAIQPSDGMIVAAGVGQPVGQERDFAVARYDDTDGDLDPAFDGSGSANGVFSFSLSAGDDFDEARDVEIDSQGRIAMAGPVTANAGDRDVGVVRLLAAGGDFDPDFSGDGKVIQAVGPADDFVRGVAIDSADNVITAGDTEVSDTEDDVLVQRYLGEETPVISVSDVTVSEGDAGTADAVFHVTLDEPPTGPLSVDYATADGTATAPSDYTALPTTPLPFGLADTDLPVTVSVNGDTADERSETFSLDLSNASGGVIADGHGVGTIADDEPPKTRITSAPANRSTDRSPTFRFKSNDPQATFRCALDRGRFRRCGSPKRYHGLDPGRHVFKVRARDAAGNVDRSPASDSFRILR